MNLGVGAPSFRFVKWWGSFVFGRNMGVVPCGLFPFILHGREAGIATHPNGAGRKGARGKMYPPKKVLTS